MNLRSTRRHWNRFAQTDPLWAVLTDPTKQNGRWRIDEFFATGRAAIEAEVRRIEQRAPNLRRQRALDFGCGIGRLTQGLAEHFHAVDGVDIAEHMLRLAAQHNRHGERVRYHHNTRSDLRLFESDRFDLVYSDITLQHVEPQYAERYIAEFARVCAPGGVISFQVPSRVPHEPPLERFKFSSWPPTLIKRIIRFTRQRWVRLSWAPLVRAAPIMEVHAVPRERVIELLENGGTRLLSVEENDAAGPRVESYRYVALKA